ncbi:hypothetical protein BH09ACT7_BH09ACT7_31170 [soil metagenome]
MDIIVTAAAGIDLVVRVQGDGDPVVFLHGSGGGLQSWAEIAAALAPDFLTRLVARRGWWPSGIPLQRNTFADEAADTLAIAAHAAAETGRRVHLVSGSCGALVVSWPPRCPTRTASSGPASRTSRRPPIQRSSPRRCGSS